MSRRPVRAPGVLDDAMSDGHLLLEQRSGDYFRIEDTAAAVWELCDGTRDEEAIVAVIAERWDAPPKAVAADVARFLDDCAAAGLVRFAG